MDDTTHTAPSDERGLVRDMMRQLRTVMLVTSTASGDLVSRPMSIQEADDDWIVRFICQRDNDVATQSDGRPVNLASMDGARYLSLSGTGHVETDPAKKQELWDRITEAYAGRPDDPDNVILEVSISSAEYWDGGNRVARLVGLAKAAVTGDRPEGGRHGPVEL